MAFVPDQTIERLREVTPSAFGVYSALCRYRNHTTRRSRVSIEALQRDTGIPARTIYRALVELKTKLWIVERGDGTELLCGSFAPVDRQRATDVQPRGVENRVENFATGGTKDAGAIATGDNNFATGDNNFATGDNNFATGDNLHIKDRARVSSTLTSTLTSTHTPAARATPDAPPANGAGVCVSRFTLEILLSYAAAHALGHGWVTQARRTGEWDELVARDAARRQPQAQTLPGLGASVHEFTSARPPPVDDPAALAELETLQREYESIREILRRESA